MKKSVVAATVTALLLLAGCGGTAAPPVSAPADSPSAQPTTNAPSPEPSESTATQTFTMPDLVGKNLQKAQDELQSLGSYLLDQQDASGAGRVQLNDRNWKVCSQQPDAGTEVPITATVVLASVKSDENCPGSGAETPAAEEPTTKPEEPKEETAKIGDTVRVGDLAVKVVSAERKTKLNSVFGSKKGNWMLVTVKITNKGKDQVMVNDSDFALLEPDGTKYSTDSDGMTYIDSDDWLFLKKINPKTSATGKMLFAIPKSAKNLTLQVSSGLFGLKTAEISLGKK